MSGISERLFADWSDGCPVRKYNGDIYALTPGLSPLKNPYQPLCTIRDNDKCCEEDCPFIYWLSALNTELEMEGR